MCLVLYCNFICIFFFFFKQKTAYEMRISDWSSDVCSSDLLEGEEAAALSFAEDGQVLLSFRDIDTIALLDLESEKIVWTMRGGWIGQHDPDVLANGNILLYDNLGGFEQSGRTRILEVDPDNGGVVWRYAGSLAQPFESEARD